ncbi:MAG TPA: UDP-3-O-(3-hydroxymyristoyl)glucosamine N-acyltransferase [Chromatiales bacterium]|nr:UDP-3-O-(3-hydroxymyristoyl)glucosamine N-acyltransferase [Chromatiales bacterium]
MQKEAQSKERAATVTYPLAELAQRSGAELRGDGKTEISAVAPLNQAVPGSISFLNDSRYREHLRNTQASAVILKKEDVSLCPVDALVTDNPYLVYARVAALLFPLPAAVGGRHPSAVVAESAEVHQSAWIGPQVVIEGEAKVGQRVYVGPGSVVGAGCVIGDDSRLVAKVSLCQGTRIGRRNLIHPGVVIGADGFGLANDQGRWVKVPQLGGVRLGDDVEVGANTTIDRGAIEDTVIADGVKLDNQIQVAHNVYIGEHTAIAGCAGIAGSTRIGRHCTVGGGVGISGHLTIGDNVHFTGQTLVTRSIEEPGSYSGNLPVMPTREWRRAVAWIRRLDGMMQRLKALEKRLQKK